MNEERRNKMSPAKAREERLAAKLRENLRRRKAQSRAQNHGASQGPGDSGATESLSNRPDES